jgi:hypothetical protein
MCRRLRGQARSHREFVAPPNQWSTRNIVGASLLAKAVDQPAKILDVPPSSRASPLPQGFCGTTKSLVNTEHCGSELARESGGSAGKDVGCTAVFAGKPAATGFGCTTKSMVNTEHCGSEPARESAGSAGKDVECAAVFASRPAPTEVVAPPNHWSIWNIVGASLLAKAVDQPAKMLNVPPPSRAGSLPQGIAVPLTKRAGTHI